MRMLYSRVSDLDLKHILQNKALIKSASEVKN